MYMYTVPAQYTCMYMYSSPVHVHVHCTVQTEAEAQNAATIYRVCYKQALYNRLALKV